jgi:hypothetical protein
MIQYVYILSDYMEDGAHHVCATLDRMTVASLLFDNWPDKKLREPLRQFVGRDAKTGAALWERGPSFISVARTSLTMLMEKSDHDLAKAQSGHNLNDGWGGIKLHVVKLRYYGANAKIGGSKRINPSTTLRHGWCVVRITKLKRWGQNLLSEVHGQRRRRSWGDKLNDTIVDKREVWQRFLIALQGMVSGTSHPPEEPGVKIFGQCRVLSERSFYPLIGSGHCRPLKFRRDKLTRVSTSAQIRSLNEYTSFQELPRRRKGDRLISTRRKFMYKRGVRSHQTERSIRSRFKQCGRVTRNVDCATGWNIESSSRNIEASYSQTPPKRICRKYQIHAAEEVRIFYGEKRAWVSDNERKD